MAKMMKVMGGGPTCTCSPKSFVWLVIGVIVIALGFWAVIKGLMMQWGGSMDWMRIAMWYAIGLLVMCIGKGFKCKACPACFSK